MDDNVKISAIYKHFKGTLYEVIAIGTDTETKEQVVIYRPYNSSSQDKIWVRPYNSFISKVDKVKYPEVEQEYRFEYVKMFYEIGRR